jgi:serine/threonine protein kinase
VANLGLQLCSAIGYLHAYGALHLDLKPDNIVAEAGRAKVLDLSLSRPPGRAHAGIGTRPYMAPEQARGGLLTEAADVWGIGAVLHKAASGRRPFAEYDADERYPQVERRAPSLLSRRPVSRALAAAVDSCLEPEPGRRPALPELARRLRAALPAEVVAAWRGRLPGPGWAAAAA